MTTKRDRPILCYTTSVETAKTASEIMGSLARFKARTISQDFDDNGHLTAIAFQIEIDGQMISYRLPANPEGVLRTLKRDAEPRYRNMEQAKRVAWRIVRHWIDAQLAMVESENAKAEEIFLPYQLAADGRTFWECIQAGGGVGALAGGQLALTDGTTT